MDAVATAFDSVPRADFLPRGWRSSASFDGPIPIGAGQTNSQPRTVEAMLRLLEVRPGDRVLDVGSGSGWSTALLAFLTGPEGMVLGVELVPRLVTWGAKNLASTGFGWARIREATRGVVGAPDAAPYDRILVSADGGSVPRALVDQLTEDGRMVLPAAGRLVLVVRAGDRTVTSEHGHYRFVPLR
ncbi:MAG: protein-L-isoaspartate(D-aspartate) O-methyltransferase [Nocardioidaceae bacterium]|nr:protein-L-isoaspartate(D-aspartate) O-methyltransferase [Nocardioidaceae bacterium]